MLYVQSLYHHYYLTKLWWSVTDKGWSSRMVSTPCCPDPLFRADNSQHKHSTSSRFAIVAKRGCFGVFTTLQICAWITQNYSRSMYENRIKRSWGKVKCIAAKNQLYTVRPLAKQLTCVILQFKPSTLNWVLDMWVFEADIGQDCSNKNLKDKCVEYHCRKTRRLEPFCKHGEFIRWGSKWNNILYLFLPLHWFNYRTLID